MLCIFLSSFPATSLLLNLNLKIVIYYILLYLDQLYDLDSWSDFSLCQFTPYPLYVLSKSSYFNLQPTHISDVSQNKRKSLSLICLLLASRSTESPRFIFFVFSVMDLVLN